VGGKQLDGQGAEADMEFLQALQGVSLGGLVFNIFAFLVALILIVFVHEYGHFIVGRWCGVKIEAFSVGFGRELFGFNDKHGTRWKFCAIPLGGYVKFEGDANAASQPDLSATHSPTSLHAQPVHERMAIVAAGPVANFILAIFIFAVAFMAIGYPYMRPIVDEVVAGSAAETAGLKPGDLVKRIDGQEISSFVGIQEAVFLRPGETLEVVVERNGTPVSLNVVPQMKEIPDNFGGTSRFGLMGVKHNPRSDEPLYHRYAPHEALGKAVERTWFTIATTGKFIAKMFTGQQSVKQIGGAVSIGKGAGDAASGGLLTFAYFIGFLSISIGIINLFPIPMLDGGHLVFYAIEAVRGRPLGPVAQEWGYRIGFSCVVMLMVLGLFNDAGRVVNVVFGT
jgi:regulator of sigma E protease